MSYHFDFTEEVLPGEDVTLRIKTKSGEFTFVFGQHGHQTDCQQAISTLNSPPLKYACFQADILSILFTRIQYRRVKENFNTGYVYFISVQCPFYMHLTSRLFGVG